MQLKQSNDVTQQYKGTIAGLKKIVKDEGLTGLYKGIVYNYMTDSRCCAEIDPVSTQCSVSIHV